MRILLVLLPWYVSATAGEADVVAVEHSCNEARSCRFDVTVAHDDEGWDHYADKWEIRSADGELLATRELLHPHTNEQPFTRSLLNVRIPAELAEVVIRARDSVHGYGGAELTVSLTD